MGQNQVSFIKSCPVFPDKSLFKSCSVYSRGLIAFLGVSHCTVYIQTAVCVTAHMTVT